MGYIVTGKPEGKDEYCLIYVCGSKENAEATLKQLLENPDKNDLMILERTKYVDFRIEETKPEDEWWNDSFYMSD